MLDPNIQFREWSELEEIKLMRLVKKNKKYLNFSEIAKHFKGRTDKNCWRKFKLLNRGRIRKK